MDWSHLALVIVVSGVVASVSDWLFMGVLFHKRYLEAPEIWRPATSERNKIIYSELIGLTTCAAFAWLLAATGQTTLGGALKMATAVWVIGPLPVIFTNVLWIKLSPWIGVAHSLGWLTRLAVTALAASYLL